MQTFQSYQNHMSQISQFKDEVKKSSSQSLIKMQTTQMTSSRINGSNQIKEHSVKENVPKSKSGANKKGQDGGSGSTKVENTNA